MPQNCAGGSGQGLIPAPLAFFCGLGIVGGMANAFIESLRSAISFAERAKNSELLGALNKALLDGSEIPQ